MGGKNGMTLKVPRDLKAFEDRLGDLTKFPFRKAAQDIANAMRNSTLRRFKAQNDSEGKTWKPSKRAARKGDKTLIDTGDLRGSLTTAATEDEAQVGTNKKYARIHEFGGKAGNNATIPQRSYLRPAEQDIALALKILAAHVEKATKGTP